jgi:hypothetical protein
MARRVQIPYNGSPRRDCFVAALGAMTGTECRAGDFSCKTKPICPAARKAGIAFPLDMGGTNRAKRSQFPRLGGVRDCAGAANRRDRTPDGRPFVRNEANFQDASIGANCWS